MKTLAATMLISFLFSRMAPAGTQGTGSSSHPGPMAMSPAGAPLSISYQLQLLPGQVFHAKFYYWSLSASLSAQMSGDPSAPWLTLSDTVFTSASCLDVKVVGYNFVAPAGPGVYQATIRDLLGNFTQTIVTLLVTPTPEISVDSIVVQIHLGDSFTKRDTLFWIGWTGLGCTNLFQPGPTTDVVYTVSPATPELSIVPSSFTIGTDTVIVQKQVMGTTVGSFVTYEALTSQWGSYVRFIKWYVTVQPPTGVGEANAGTHAGEYRLEQNSPNPFNPSTIIRYQLPSVNHVTLMVYNVLGQEIATLVDEQQGAGSHEAHWNGKSLVGLQVNTGVYFCRISAHSTGGSDQFTGVTKMLLLK